MYFHRIPVLLLCLSNCLVVAQDRTLVAEGGYVMHTTEGPKRYDDWKLWQEPDGEFSAEVVASAEANPQGPTLTQIFRFDQQFLPTGYSLTAVSRGGADRMSVNCRSDSNGLSCSTQFRGKVLSAFTKTRGPSLVLLDDFPALDLPWFHTAFFRIAQLNKQSSSVDVYVLKEKTAEEFILRLDSPPSKFRASGEEITETLGGTQIVRSYEIDPNNEPQIINVASNGLVLSMGFKGAKHSLFELAGYKQYKHLAQ
jgi:hypothetical protein